MHIITNTDILWKLAEYATLILSLFITFYILPSFSTIVPLIYSHK